jgi:hemerythrin-like domain-containing protein
MKTATEDLENDHVHILRLIDVMEHMTGLDSPEVSHLELIISLIREFADGLHHAKEENILFPYLEGKGFSSRQGPVAVMLHEHIVGRAYVKGMADNVILYKSGDSAALKQVYNNMSGYAELLRNHISKENNILFKMADRVLSNDDQERLLSHFSAAAENLNNPANPQEYINKIEELATYYNV